MFFPRLSGSSINFLISSLGFASQICLGSHSSVSPMLTETGTCAFSYVRAVVNSFFCVFLVTIPNHRRLCAGRFLFGFWLPFLCVLIIAPPFLNSRVASRSQRSWAFYCCKKSSFPCLAVLYYFGSRCIGAQPMSSCHNRLAELQQSPSHPHPRIKHDGYGFSTPCLCAQASGLMPQKFVLCCSCKKLSLMLSLALRLSGWDSW